jgi:integrase
MQNVATDRRHDRRPFFEKELAALLKAAEAGPIVRCMKGPDRAMLYRVAVYTGLWASELASLKPESFELESDLPKVSVQAAYSKHRRTDVLPLHQSLVAQPRSWLSRKPA